MNICGGDCLKELLEKNFQQPFIAFREAMNEGPLPVTLFDDHFLSERAKFHKTSKSDYVKHMQAYISAINNLKENEEICLWFGEDLFCQINMLVVLAHIEAIKAPKEVIINIVDEASGKVLNKATITPIRFLKTYFGLSRGVAEKTSLKSVNEAIKTYLKTNKKA